VDRIAYLLLGSPFALGAALIARRYPALRPRIVWMALAGACLGPLSEYWFEKDYWRPRGVLGAPLLEDVLFGAGFCAFSASIGDVVCRRRAVRRAGEPRLATGAVLLGVYAVTMTLAQSLLGLNSILVSSALGAAFAAFMVSRRRDLLGSSLLSATLLGSIAVAGYGIGLNTLLEGGRYLRSVWLLAGTRLGATILGVPVTEVVWFACWGACLGIGFQYVAGERTAPAA
jgi:hypothetical protein